MYRIEALANVHLPDGLMLMEGEERKVEEITSSMEKAERLGLLRITRPPAPEPTRAPEPRKRRRGG